MKKLLMATLALTACGAAEERPIARIDRARFGQLREAFNAAADRTRVVALLSPT